MRTFAVVALATLGLLAPRPACAQSEGEMMPDYVRAALAGKTLGAADGEIQQVDCSSCGTLKPPAMSFAGGGGGLCGDTCGSSGCKPGRTCRHSGDCCGSFFCGLGECLCCPDPCYEPRWVHVANAALFQDTVRPQTYTRFRFDAINSMTTPRIAEYLFKSDFRPVATNVDVRELTMYQEIAAGNSAFFIEMPYRSIHFSPSDLADPANPVDHHGGFTDINLGTKSLLLDCELLQLAFQFRTFLPTGSPSSGLGTGHVSLEPSVLASLKIHDRSYLQTQVAYWIPIGGNQDAQGALVHYHTSLNHLFVEKCNWQIIGMAEFNGWTFSDGLANLDPRERAGGKHFLNAGGGLRIVYCERYDLGMGYVHTISDNYLGEQQIRAEVRIRY